MNIAQTNSQPSFPIHAAEILLEIFTHAAETSHTRRGQNNSVGDGVSKMEILSRFARVCHHWEGPANSLLYETITSKWSREDV